MIVLDTNVVSEVMKADPEEKVIRLLDSVEEGGIFISSISKAEILYGVERLPLGRKRSHLAARAAVIFEEEFDGRILPFDANSAVHFGRLKAHRRSLGRRIEEPDALIAAICRQHGFAIVTRDVADFTDCGIEIIDPWAD